MGKFLLTFDFKTTPLITSNLESRFGSFRLLVWPPWVLLSHEVRWVVARMATWRRLDTWNPNGAPCFDWSLDLVLEGSRLKIKDKQVPSSYKYRLK